MFVSFIPEAPADPAPSRVDHTLVFSNGLIDDRFFTVYLYIRAAADGMAVFQGHVRPHGTFLQHMAVHLLQEILTYLSPGCRNRHLLALQVRMDVHPFPVHAHCQLSPLFGHPDEPDIITGTQKLQPVAAPCVHLATKLLNVIVDLRVTVCIWQAGHTRFPSRPVSFDVPSEVSGERRLPSPFSIGIVLSPSDIDRADIFP